MSLTDTQSRIIFGSSFILSAVLMFWRISTWSFWFDESYTSALVATDPSQIIHLTSVDVHPPLYYLVLHVWSLIFGTSDLALRSLSALLMLLSIILLVMLLKRLMEKRYAYLVASFVALAPFTIRYAQEARMYAMVSALLIGATYLFIVQMQSKRRMRQVRTWVLYAVLMTLALYTHYFSILILAAHLSYALIHDTRTKDGKTWLIRLKHRVSLVDRRFLKSLLLIPILYLPWIPTLYDQFQAVNEGFWIPPVGAVPLVSIFSVMSLTKEITEFGAEAIAGYGLLVALGTAIFFLAKKAKSEELRSLWFIYAGFLLPLIILFAFSYLPFTSSYFYYRYFAQFSMFYYAGLLFVSLLGIKHLGRMIGWSMLAIVLVFHSIGTYRVLNGSTKDNVDINIQFQKLEDNYQEGDEIVAASMWQWFNAHHYNSTSAPVKYMDTGYWWGSHAPIYDAKENILVSEDLSDVNPTSGRVWIIEPTDFVTTTPDNWEQLGDAIYGEDTDIVLYEVR